MQYVKKIHYSKYLQYEGKNSNENLNIIIIFIHTLVWYSLFFHLCTKCILKGYMSRDLSSSPELAHYSRIGKTKSKQNRKSSSYSNFSIFVLVFDAILMLCVMYS